ncbi:MAG: methionine biosynthesis protein MetW [Alcanivorax sp.]|jgi:methionine biosynthesis protein MetW|uniref:methionine biosynthesis protein MetW n=1 Tax=unclassified Ketobacter TaxID=2639109 RepID=UPI000F274339|nr:MULTISPECIES: methionine biosynthesis protein MetW [unclassified Ketobacter]MEC8810178.1 methionine biosynthesis protein MetW [Pseudomonadota bacterium]RLT90894.1 MAG: methionine biosynthesis protein MetW [Ketobacter sp. GenoA1]RLT94631.1 MAG: methionine biosynthesis protein MetW [Ketobacter sp.]TNC89976.1 MAG: methionine biosynthesis protein MetW [Alcanivorax sp.]|tara:strand:+ start:8961 stop:9551 length:591 start_codon:yes stop_codon:yes gene_type:complete
MRQDLAAIQQWVQPDCSILDLGCGDGALLAHLRDKKNVFGYGLEIDQDKILECIKKNVNVIEQDLDCGLANFENDSFDMVIMTQALQAVHYPDKVIDDMLRVGKECIITFPNFGYWRCRLYLMTKGRMPVSKQLPYTWYNTPNIHLCTFKDFEALCYRKHLKILNRTVVDMNYRDGFMMRLFPNLFGEVAVYHVTK